MVADDGLRRHRAPGRDPRNRPHRGAPTAPCDCASRRASRGTPSWRYAVEHGLAGIEALCGIPGSAGAAPIQNIGAYGQEPGSTRRRGRLPRLRTGEVERLARDELELGYRTSALKRGRLGVVLGQLARSSSGRASDDSGSRVRRSRSRSHRLRRSWRRRSGVELGAGCRWPSVRAAVLRPARVEGHGLDAADPDSVSAGSFFTNPIVTRELRPHPAVATRPRWPSSRRPSPPSCRCRPRIGAEVDREPAASGARRSTSSSSAPRG